MRHQKSLFWLFVNIHFCLFVCITGENCSTNTVLTFEPLIARKILSCSSMCREAKLVREKGYKTYEELEFFSLDKRRLRRKFITLELPERWLQQGRLLSLFHGNNWWDQGNSLKKAGLYWSKEVFLQKEGGWTLQQAAQGSSGFPITAVI